MSAPSEIMRAGVPAGQVKALFGNADGAVTAAGSSASDGTSIKTRVIVITGGSSNVVVLPTPDGSTNEQYYIYNRSGNTNAIYPPTGYTVNNTTSVNIATAKSCVVVYAQGTTHYLTIPVVPT